MRIGGTIAIKPFGMQSKASFAGTRRLAIKYAMVTTRAIIPPHGRPSVASVFENALTKLSPSRIPPLYTSANTHTTISTIIGKIRSMTLPFEVAGSSSSPTFSPYVNKSPLFIALYS